MRFEILRKCDYCGVIEYRSKDIGKVTCFDCKRKLAKYQRLNKKLSTVQSLTSSMKKI